MRKAPDIKFFEIDYMDNINLARQYSVVYLPTVIVFDNGKVQSMIQGLKKEKKYYEKIGVKY